MPELYEVLRGEVPAPFHLRQQPGLLRELPEDCAIFICNVYYREIGEQIREMGLKNPVAYFNDEYMPTFHFDRLRER